MLSLSATTCLADTRRMSNYSLKRRLAESKILIRMGVAEQDGSGRRPSMIQT